MATETPAPQPSRGTGAYFYRVYGIELASPVALPELVRGGAGADVAVDLGPVAYRPPEPNRVVVVDGAIYLRFENVGTFELRGGDTVRLDGAPRLDEAALRVLLTGPILGLILHQRRVAVLHGSAVATGGAAVGFLGAVGAGKSTLAAAFEARGYPVVSDDLLAVQPSDGVVVAHAGFPQLKIAPSVVASLGEDTRILRTIHPTVHKRAWSTRESFSTRAVPLECVYSLAEGPATEIDELSPADGFIELVRNLYVASAPSLAAEPWVFEQCASLSEALPVRRLTRPLSLPTLGDVVRAVERDVV